jgi:hypothetical protein
MLCCAVLCCAVLCCAVLCCAVQRSGTSPLAQPGFVALMLTVVNSSDKAKCWEQLLTDAFKGFAGEER